MKTLQQKISFVLILCLLTMSCLTAAAADIKRPFVTIPDGVTVQAGETFDLPILVSNCENAATIFLMINFDASVFEPQGVTFSPEYKDLFQAAAFRVVDNQIRIAAPSQRGTLTAIEPVTLATIQIKVLDTAAAGQYRMQFVSDPTGYADNSYFEFQDGNEYVKLEPTMASKNVTVTSGSATPPTSSSTPSTSTPRPSNNPVGPGPGPGSSSTPTPTPTPTPAGSLEPVTSAEVQAAVDAVQQAGSAAGPYEKYLAADMAKQKWDTFTSVSYDEEKIEVENNIASAAVVSSDLQQAATNASALSDALTQAVTDAGASSFERSIVLAVPSAGTAGTYQVDLDASTLTMLKAAPVDVFTVETPVFHAKIGKAALNQMPSDGVKLQLTVSGPLYRFTATSLSGAQIDGIFGGDITLLIPGTLASGGFPSAEEAFASYLNNDTTVAPEPQSLFLQNEGMYSVPLNNDTYIRFQKSDVSFGDISDIAWAAPYINGLAARGILSGVGEGIFEPNRNVTREEFTKMIIAAFDLFDASATCDFADVPSDAWYYPYVASAAQLGIVNGIGDGQFGVGQQITRQDMATIAKRAADVAGKTLRKTTEIAAFADDADIAAYAKENITVMQMAGILSGMGENRFEPQGSATRAQAAKVIYMLFAAR